jgi:hypothetical protein
MSKANARKGNAIGTIVPVCVAERLIIAEARHVLRVLCELLPPPLSDSERVGWMILAGLLNFFTPARQTSLQARIS